MQKNKNNFLYIGSQKQKNQKQKNNSSKNQKIIGVSKNEKRNWKEK